jgi:N-acetyl-anhydromuramyl-L-alanine amidase AmpD
MRKTAFWILGASLMLLAAVPSDSTGRSGGKDRAASDVDTIVIHTIGGPACAGHTVVFQPIPVRGDDADFWKKLLLSAPDADAHYVIGRNGKVVEAIPVLQVANHTVGLNDRSIGIELVNRGDGLEPFPEQQVKALVDLIKSLKDQFPSIRQENVIRHSDFDQRTCICGDQPYHRRQDPGAAFPFDKVMSEVGPEKAQTGQAMLPPPLVGPAPARACAKTN